MGEHRKITLERSNLCDLLGTSKSNQFAVIWRIKEQTHRGDQLTPLGRQEKFGDVTITSLSYPFINYPLWNPANSELRVRGDNTNRDKEVFFSSFADADKIEKAIRLYNEKYNYLEEDLNWKIVE